MQELVRNIWSYRYLLWNLTVKELKLKYKNSTLGFFWSLLNPLLTLIIYTVVFSTVMKVPVAHFPLYLLAGLLPWLFLQSSVMDSANSMISNAGILKKVYFPREIIPFSLVLSGLLNFVMTLVVLFIGIVFYQIPVGPSLLMLPVLLLIQMIFVTGFGLVVSVLTAKYRDLAHLLGVLFNAWFYATPIVYPVSMVPHALQAVLRYNPFLWFVEMFRDVILYDRMPPWPNFVITLGAAAGMFYIGLGVFRLHEFTILERI